MPADVPVAVYERAPELGYVVVDPVMRGRRLSGALADGIASGLADPCFATTDSPTMRNNLCRSGFSQTGVEWRGSKGALSLWLLPR